VRARSTRAAVESDRARDIYVPDLRFDTIKVEARDFH
jgi:hypothetical protein